MEIEEEAVEVEPGVVAEEVAQVQVLNPVDTTPF
jgi:hypothetical protein